MTIRKIDEHNANAFTRWKEMGSPVYLTNDQLDELHKASEVPQVYLRPNAVIHGSDCDAWDTYRFDLILPPASLQVITLTF